MTERRVLPAASAALQHDFSNCNKGEKEQSVLPPVDCDSSCFQFLHEVWSEWCLQNWQRISVTQEVVLEKTKKEKKKKTLGEIERRGKKKIFHSGIFRSGLRHCQRNSLRHNKVLWQGTALWNCPCLMFSSVGFAVELQFCSYLCHIEVHRHTDCYLWGKSHFGPSSNKVTILWLSAKWWRVRSQAVL